MRIVVLGAGFLGREVARRAKDAGHDVVATARSEEAGQGLSREGIEVRVAARLTGGLVEAIVSPEASILVAFPPDGVSDAEIAGALGRARRVVYVSTTGVYGTRRGRVDEDTPVDEADPRARRRLIAERLYAGAGAIVLRPAGIYGPWRGLHRRLLDGTLRAPVDAAQVVSRVHVGDLARIVLALLREAPRGEAPHGPGWPPEGRVFVVADDAPVPQIDVIRWLCERLALPVPPPAVEDELAPSLRHDRRVDNARVKRALGLTLEYPTYREGFTACLEAEGLTR